MSSNPLSGLAQLGPATCRFGMVERDFSIDFFAFIHVLYITQFCLLYFPLNFCTQIAFILHAVYCHFPYMVSLLFLINVVITKFRSCIYKIHMRHPHEKHIIKPCTRMADREGCDHWQYYHADQLHPSLLVCLQGPMPQRVYEFIIQVLWKYM